MFLDLEIFLTIIAVYMIVVISPGPNFLLVVRYSLRYPKKLTMMVTLGLAVGATINASITMFGVGTLISTFPLFGLVISVLGGSYMAYLGLSAIKSALKDRSNKPQGDDELIEGSCAPEQGQSIPAEHISYMDSFQKGLLVNLLNPKGIVFFLALYAPLISQASLTTKGLVIVTCFFIEILWYGLVTFILSRPKFQNLYWRASFAIDCILGSVLMLLGIRILVQARMYF